MRAGAWIIALVVAAGCGEVDLTGIYRVDSAVGSAPCGADTALEYPPFLKFTKDEFFGRPFFTYEGCPDDTGEGCSSMGGLFGAFVDPIDDGWERRTSFSSGGGGGDCLLGLDLQTALLRDAALEVETSSYADQVPGLSEEACSPDEAERRGTAMPCTGHTLVEATRL